ncbi:hypothetical protein RvY_14764-2, partial [Ramazzottius varieornatus]
LAQRQPPRLALGQRCHQELTAGPGSAWRATIEAAWKLCTISIRSRQVSYARCFTMNCRRPRIRKRLLLYAVIIFLLYRCIVAFALEVVILNVTPESRLNVSSYRQSSTFSSAVEDARAKYRGIFAISVLSYPHSSSYRTCQESK